MPHHVAVTAPCIFARAARLASYDRYNVFRKKVPEIFLRFLCPLARSHSAVSVPQICKRRDRAALFRDPAGIILDVLGQLLLCLVLRHRCRSECFFLLLANPPTTRVRHPEMKEPDPYFALAVTFDLFDPARVHPSEAIGGRGL